MAIFDIEKNELLRLSDTQLEELIARLAEAEIALYGHSPAYVNWSGSINAADGGIDIHVQVPEHKHKATRKTEIPPVRVQVPVDDLSTGFIEKPNTVFQAKIHSIPKAKITKEMCSRNKLSPVIVEQASRQGSYIIVSLRDDCSPKGKAVRLQAMRDAVKDDPNKNNLHLDFYDRSKLTQWLRQHPSVMLWVKGKLGQEYSGWQPYGAWSNPPQGIVDTLISAPGIVITLPLEKGQRLSIGDSINPIRDLIRTTNKAVRIIGFSGVGKTRIVQALFDETIGTNPLDRTVALYGDTGTDPNPSATAMLDRLIAEDRNAIMILDNCSSELHSTLASKVSAAGGKVSLITIEYDIKDDKPQTTEVIHIEAIGPEMAEQLLIRRFPDIGRSNAHQIAKFAQGNARVSLAVAERVKESENLARLSDDQLFNRLFEQRNHPDNDLQEQAEILSLVYSFSAKHEVGQNELAVLGSLSEYSQDQLFRSIAKLSARHLIQKRAHWGAILPHIIANRLAESALNSIPVYRLKSTFEAPGCQRLLMSFAHRLGLLHDHPVAKEIAETWLQPDGLLGRITELDDMSARMLVYIAPVVPEALLNRIEAVLTSPDFKGMERLCNPHRLNIITLLQSLAYEASDFERCVRLLITVADHEDENNTHDPVRDKITSFFQPYLSGSHAFLSQRITIMDECLSSDIAGRRSLGFRMLSTALSGPHWSGIGINEFGARPRDFGREPDYDALVEWRNAFVNVVVRLGISGNPDLEVPARSILASKFSGIWYQKAMRGKLIDAARRLHAYSPWHEGWRAVRSIIHFNYTKPRDGDEIEQLPNNLAVLEKELEPTELISTIITYMKSDGFNYWFLDADFDHRNLNKFPESSKRLEAKALRWGQEFALSNHKLDELGSNLFSTDGMPYRAEFGMGLARGAHDLRISWQQLVEQIEKQPDINKNFSVFKGFIEEVDSVDPALAQCLLNQCAQHPVLRQALVDLHPGREFTVNDLDRCMKCLDDPDIRLFMYGPIFWKEQYANLPKDRVLDLAKRLLSKASDGGVLLHALSMKLYGKDESVDTLGSDFRSIGLAAAIKRIQENHSDQENLIDDSMERVINAVLRFDGNEAEKLEWVDAIFAVVDKHYGLINTFKKTIAITAALMPEAFLNRIFEGTDEQQRRRLFFIRHRGLRDLPPLAKIDMSIVIAWCRARNDSRVWPFIAAGVTLWSKNGEQNVIILQKSAIELLEASPEPVVVLESFAERIRPSSWWSGSLANIMQLRADAIGMLIKHERSDISEAARVVYEKLIHYIEHQKKDEQRKDSEREQRFE